MRLNFFKTTGLLLLACLLMPVGMLLASDTYETPAVASSTANWYNVEQASDLFNQMNTLALQVRKEVGRLQAQGYELNWREHSARLARAKNHINAIGDDLAQLKGMKSRLEPWQQSLIERITPDVHAMVYQTDAALRTLKAHENRHYLALSQYPNNIDKIYRNSNQMANTIDTVTQYAHAEEKMAELNKMNGRGIRFPTAGLVLSPRKVPPTAGPFLFAEKGYSHKRAG